MFPLALGVLVSPGNYDKTKTPPAKQRAPKGSKARGKGRRAPSTTLYLDPITASAWKFLEGKVQRQKLLTDHIQAEARKHGWTPPEGEKP